MLVVVPVKEGAGPKTSLFHALKAVRVIGSILHGLELGLGKGIVVGGVGPGVALGNPQVLQ